MIVEFLFLFFLCSTVAIADNSHTEKKLYQCIISLAEEKQKLCINISNSISLFLHLGNSQMLYDGQ